MPEFADVYEWLQHGIERGFCSPSTCATHDGLPYTEEEQVEWEGGGDPCVHVVRLLHPGEELSGA